MINKISAFPFSIPDQTSCSEYYAEGLSKRELFAAMAMQGFLSDRNNHSCLSHREIAEAAVAQADALLEALLIGWMVPDYEVHHED